MGRVPRRGPYQSSHSRSLVYQGVSRPSVIPLIGIQMRAHPNVNIRFGGCSGES